ncbi:MAG: YlxR family protein [Chloroflexi bacterium]|nr:YlxR family protein [Chloroflexota bacterium]
MSNTPQGRPLPQRTCVGCGKVTDKRALLRVVRVPSGEIRLDATGKAPGRGAYICSDIRCWESALKRKRLARVLKVSLTTLDEARVLQEARAALATQQSGKQEQHAK